LGQGVSGFVIGLGVTLEQAAQGLAGSRLPQADQGFLV